METTIDFSEITLRVDTSRRGGGIEIDLTDFGFEGHKMSAYQNYLGGGMLGKICSCNTITNSTFETKITDAERILLEEISENLKKYFHSLTNPDEDEFESVSYIQNQNMPKSAY